MRIRHFGFARSGYAAAVLLAACGGSQSPVGPPGAVPEARAVEAHANRSNYKVLFSFGSSTYDGLNPVTSLIDVNGTLYGTTPNGGSGSGRISGCFDGCGTVFNISPAGLEHVLYSFKGGSDGSEPDASLLDVNGTLYGTTEEGGGGDPYSCPEGCGTVFSISTAGHERVLHVFGNSSDGTFPEASLINEKGRLYGTTNGGGTYGYGTVFRISTTGKEEVVHSFGSGSDGLLPFGGLLDVNGTLYGTTAYGGSYGNNGTVFSVNASGRERLPHSFRGYPDDGTAPYASLIDVTGTLYGTTHNGGAYGEGTVFSLSASGVELALHSFGGGSDGDDPAASLLDVNGVLYGTTQYRGLYKWGTVFSISPTGTERVLHSFGSGSDGENPTASLINVKGTLYGTTGGGGDYGDGTVFSIQPEQNAAARLPAGPAASASRVVKCPRRPSTGSSLQMEWASSLLVAHCRAGGRAAIAAAL